MARSNETPKPFNDYDVEISLTVRRKEGYSSETMTHVQLNEMITCPPHVIGDTFEVMAADAVTRARRKIGVKHDFEADIRALDAPAVDVER